MKRLEPLRILGSALLIMAVAPRVAPCQAPDDFVPCEDVKDQFSISLPPGWTTYDQMAAIMQKSSPYGVIIFSPVKFGELEVEKQIESISGIDSGTIPSFFVDRSKAKKGMSCAEFTEKAQKELLKTVGGDPLLARGRKILEPLHADATTIGDCHGVRIRARSQDEAGIESIIDVHALSDGKTLYLFSLRNVRENYDRNLPVYEKAMSTVKLTGTR